MKQKPESAPEREADLGRSPVVEWAPLALAAGLALAAVARFIGATQGGLDFPYAVNYGEGVVLDQAVRVATGVGLYLPIEKAPHVVDNYTPLYPALASLWLHTTGVSFWGGRLVSFLACLAIACVLYAMVFLRRPAKFPGEARAIAAGIIAAGAFLGAGETLTWGGLYRVDCLGVALSIAGFALAASGLRCGLFLAAPFFLASLAALQSLVAAPLAAYGAVALEDRRRALRGALALASLVGAGLLAGHIASSGFLTHIIRYNVLPFEWSSLWVKYLHPMLTTKAPLLAAAAVAFVALRRDPAARPFLILAPLSLIVALSMGRRGADANYLLIPIAAIAALAARGIAGAPRLGQRAALAGLAAAQLALSLAVEAPRVGRAERAAISRRDARILEAISRVGGPILFEEPALALLSGKPVEYEPFMCTQLAAIGLWDPAPLAAGVAARRYGAVQRTSWIAEGAAGATVQWQGDRTIPAVAAALQDEYAPAPNLEFSRPIAPGLGEAYGLWLPRAPDRR